MKKVGTALVTLRGGQWVVGTDEPWLPGEGEDPARPVVLDPFAIGRCAVSVADFAAFVADTGHTTTAERLGWSFIFAAHVDEGAKVIGGSSAGPWWRAVAGATWERPRGRHPGEGEHPAVHVSRTDARAYCAWAGGRLPTEAEWEYAAAGGTPGAPFPWGHELEPDGTHRCNVWQGAFPSKDTGADGHRGTAPVDAYVPNDFGLRNVIGNVWEWCADPYRTAATDGPCCAPATPAAAYVQKGGSHLCHESYCARYRIQARIGSPADSTTGNAGFRIAMDA